MRKQPSQPEFIALIALLTSIMALTTDAMLPVLPDMAAAMGMGESNRIQLVVSLFILGTGLGQLFFGPLADYLGRRTSILSGLVLFMAGTVVCLSADSFTTMLIGRFVQGLGAAGPRTASTAMVRDLYQGRAMARVMSFVMAVFILVPAVAPSLGQGVAHFWGWQAVFGLFIAVALWAFVWMGLRQPETNPPQNRHAFSWGDLARATKTVASHKETLRFTLIGGLMFTSFIAYLSSAQQVFEQVFAQVETFPIYFALMALSIGAASFVNAKLVMRLGMHRLTSIALSAITLISFAYLGLILLFPEAVSLGSFLVWGVVTFFFVGLVFGNVNALAMEPMGKVAGVAAAMIGAASSIISVGLGIPLARLFDGSIIPLIAGFAVLNLANLIIIKFRP